MAIRVPAGSARMTRGSSLVSSLVIGALVLGACGDGATEDNPDGAAPVTSATVAAKVETRDPTTTEAASADPTTTTAADTSATDSSATDSSATTTSTIVSTTTSRPGKVLELVPEPTTATSIRSTTSSTAAPVTTTPATTTTAVAPTTTAAPTATTVASTSATGGSTSDAAADDSATSSEADQGTTGENDSAAGSAEADGSTSADGATADGQTNAGSDDSTAPTTVAPAPSNAELPPLAPGVVARPTCAARPDGDGRVACSATLSNGTDAYTRISTSVAFFDAAGEQLSTENRFMNYVAPGETFVQEFFGPATTARADVIESTPTAIAQPQLGTARITDRGTYLPVDASVLDIGTLEADTIGRQTSVVVVENSAGITGTVTVKVAFFDADGVRVSNESRFVPNVEAGAEVTQKFFGEPGATRAEVLEIKVVAD